MTTFAQVARFMRTGVLEPDVPKHHTVKHRCEICGAEFHSPAVGAACCTQRKGTPWLARSERACPRTPGILSITYPMPICQHEDLMIRDTLSRPTMWTV